MGRALVDALGELARSRGSHSMWVSVDGDNEPALATYRSAGGRASDQVVFDWTFRPGSRA